MRPCAFLARRARSALSGHGLTGRGIVAALSTGSHDEKTPSIA